MAWYKRYNSIGSKYQHEIDRINQFIDKSKDEAHLRQLLITRAGRCGPEKLVRFVSALKEMGMDNLAMFIRMTIGER